ncbi:pyridoxal phosphate-dependent aminotransferase [Salmonella enterica subsp. enterica serovar Cubana]|nr:pyridoxal phosphate-dependent aminotransferase [Salmonella enterica subsp. enterica serovar Cubana]
MKYDFDEIIDRKNSNSMNTDGFRQYIFHADESMKFAYEDDEFIRMWIADMEFATPEVVIDEVKKRLDKRIFGYTKIFGPEYYESFLSWTEKLYNWTFKKEHLVTSPGIIPALYELVSFITRPDEKILIMTPSYAYFKHAVDFHGRELVCTDLINDNENYQIDFDDLEKKASDPKTTLCIFCSPHNPTGRVWTPSELERFGEICQKNNLWIISDEIHCDLIRSHLTHTPLAKVMPDYDKIITCMAPSKTFNLAGMMLSNIIIPNDELMKTWKSRHYDFENPLSIACVQAAYKYGFDWMSELKKYLDDNFLFMKDFLKENLPEAKFSIPEATYLGWVDVSHYLPEDTDLSMFFANHAGVLLEGGKMFVQNGDGYIRLNLACPRAVLINGLQRIAKALKNYNN